MRFPRGAGWLTVLLLSFLVVLGCKKAPTGVTAEEGGGQMSPARDGAGGAVMGAFASGHKLLDLTDLKQLGLAYLSEADTNSNRRGPASLEAWTSLKREHPKGYDAIKEGDLIMIWGANLNNVPAGASNTILGYVKDVPTRGGAVVFVDGSARKVQPDEFKTLTLAK